jgi:hypothetical protein
MFTDQLGKRVVVRGELLLRPPQHLFFIRLLESGQIFKDDVDGFSSTSDICCIKESLSCAAKPSGFQNLAVEYVGRK